MQHRTIRLLVAFGMTALLAIGGTVLPGAAAATASPVVLTQTIVGGGSGFGGPQALDFARWEGKYVSTSQLGVGHYQIGWVRVGSTFSYTGTEFIRSDGMKLTGDYSPGNPADCGAAQPNVDCLHVDLAGNADIANAHLLISITSFFPAGPGPVASGFLMRGTLTLRRRLGGYMMLDTRGTTYAFGGLDHLGDAHVAGATDLELTPSHNGFWIVNTAGQVFVFGDATAFGNANPSRLTPGETVSNMSGTPTGKGYWLFTSKGRVLPFGDARFLGDLHTTHLNGRIVGSIATPTGHGYYMVGADGGVFAFGDATFHGSTGKMRLNRPVVGLVLTADNTGYWLVASDGGVFSFNAPFHGSMGGIVLNQPIVTMVPYDNSYLMVASDGGAFNFSKGLFFGSEGDVHLPTPIVAGAATG